MGSRRLRRWARRSGTHVPAQVRSVPGAQQVQPAASEGATGHDPATGDRLPRSKRTAASEAAAAFSRPTRSTWCSTWSRSGTPQPGVRRTCRRGRSRHPCRLQPVQSVRPGRCRRCRLLRGIISATATSWRIPGQYRFFAASSVNSARAKASASRPSPLSVGSMPPRPAVLRGQPDHGMAVHEHDPPDSEAVRRNAYWRFFGLDLAFGTDDNRPPVYDKANAANTNFIAVRGAVVRAVAGDD